MKRINIVISILLMGFGAYYALLTSRLPTRKLPNTLGMDFIPWLLVGCLLFLAALLLVVSIWRESAETCNYRISGKEAGGILFLTLTVYAYIQAINWAGFLISTPLFLAVLMVVTGSRKWREIVLGSLLTSFGVYFFFQKIFQVILPGGT
jgi:hypothetical protein